MVILFYFRVFLTYLVKRDNFRLVLKKLHENNSLCATQNFTNYSIFQLLLLNYNQSTDFLLLYFTSDWNVNHKTKTGNCLDSIYGAILFFRIQLKTWKVGNNLLSKVKTASSYFGIPYLEVYKIRKKNWHYESPLNHLMVKICLSSWKEENHILIRYIIMLNYRAIYNNVKLSCNFI